MPETDIYPDEITSLFELVERAKALFGDATYIIAAEPGLDDISFTTLLTFICNFDDYLDELGIEPGDGVASVFHNSTLAALLFVATISAGRVYVPLNPKMAEAEISHILRQTKPRLMVYNAEVKSRVEAVDNAGRLVAVADEIAFLKEIMRRSPAGNSIEPGAGQFDRTAEVVFTSGSTGLPKGVVLTHRNLLRNSFAMTKAFGFDRGSRFLTACPLFHNSGQLFTSLSALWCGGLHVPVRSDFAMLNFWDLVDRYELQWTVVMNSFLALLVQRPDSHRKGTMKGILSGGSKLKLDLVDRFESRFKVPVLQCYGLTETTSISTAERPGKSLAGRGSAGQPLPGCRIRIVLDNQEKPRLEHGEILVSGEHLFSYYLNQPDVTAEKVRDGWLHTGDLGYMDAEDNVFIVDRLDSMVHVGGENVYPNEIENLSMLLDGVEDMVVTAIPNKILGAELVLVYKARDGEQPNMTNWTDVFVRHLSTFKIPRRRVAVGELGLDGIPRAANGKLLRGTIKEAVLAKLAPESR
jgi:acyl-CoA synthetase (AMP-forming)/AMP-acid ligase II